MKVQKILLAIDGSLYSQNAAEVAWRIAKQTGAAVTALHVVDTASVVDLIGHIEPGFLDLEDYKGERDAIVESMQRAGQRLMHAYAQAARHNKTHVEVIVECGNPADVIRATAVGYDLIVIGHKPFDSNQPQRYRRQLMRLSAAEYLAESTPKPLLVVQGKPVEWKSMTIMLSLDHINRSYLDVSIEMSRQFGLQPALVCLSTSDVEEPPTNLIKDLRTSDKALAEVPIAVMGMDQLRDKAYEVWDNPTSNTNWDEWNTTLLTIPTRPVPGRRLTVADGSPARFIRYSTLPAVLLYPEESHQAVTTKSLAGAGAKKRK